MWGELCVYLRGRDLIPPYGGYTGERVKSAKAVEKVQKSAVPKKTRLNTEWAERTWHNWALYRLENFSQDGKCSKY